MASAKLVEPGPATAQTGRRRDAVPAPAPSYRVLPPRLPRAVNPSPTASPSASAGSSRGASGGASFGVVGSSAFSPPPNERVGDYITRILLVSFGTLICATAALVLRAVLGTLPPNFIARWKRLMDELANPGPKSIYESHGGTTIYDRHGTVVARIVDTGSSSGDGLRMEDIPSSLWQAVVASEDRRFFQHKGIDPRALTRALFSLAERGGGSTITQQLAKNLFLTSERSLSRKLTEILLALALEWHLSKWDILYLYLKKIYWGHGVHGIEAAAALFFNKHPSALSTGECALLAGIIPAPERLSPYRDPGRGRRSQGRALDLMVECGFIDAATAAAARGRPLQLATEVYGRRGTGPWRAPYFVSEVVAQLSERYGMEELVRGGLHVRSTLDLGMQEAAERLLLDKVEEFDRERVASSGCEWRPWSESDGAAAAPPQMEGAVVAIDPPTGEVRVLVGGRDYYESPFNRAVQARRPPGSTFKPVVYLAALAEGWSPDDTLKDEEFTAAEAGGFRPSNYDREFGGDVTLEESLVNSLNVPTVRLCMAIGVDRVIDMARALGIRADLPRNLGLSLGACELTPLELAAVYANIAAGGMRTRPHLILRVEAHDGRVLEQAPARRARVVPEDAVIALQKLLRAVIERGTGKAAAIGRPVAGKTGTSDGHRDAWFAGFTPDLASVVWLGYDDNSPVGGVLPGTGASHAAPLWQAFNVLVHQNLPVRQFDNPPPAKRKKERPPRDIIRREREKEERDKVAASKAKLQSRASPTEDLRS